MGRLRDTKAPSKHDSNHKALNHHPLNDAIDPKALNLGPHFKTVTQIKWCPTIPGILATGSEDESVKIWQTHLLDHTLIPVEYDNEKINKMLGIHGGDEKEDNNEEEEEEEETTKS